jgi:hypothetical protein
MKKTKIDDDFLVELIDRLTPLNNEWRRSNVALKKIKIMWEMGRIIDAAVENSEYGFDELLRKIYDPHGEKMSYITRDLLSYSHRIFVNYNSIAEIDEQLKGLTSYTLFREAFPLLTNKEYKQSDQQKKEIIAMIIKSSSTKIVQNKLKNIKQAIKPIKNIRTTKAQQYSDETKWLSELRNKTIKYYKDNETLDIKTFPIDNKLSKVLKNILLVIAFDKKTEEQFDIEKISNEQIKRLAKIANSKTEDRARFKKWGIDTFTLMTFVEMLNAIDNPDKYYFVRQKIVSKN